MSRFYEKSTILISDDVSNTPTQIRFSETLEDTDITSLKKTHTITDTFPVGTTVVNMGQISAGKFLYVKPTVDLQISVDSAVLTIKGGKAARMWASFTALSVIVPNNATNTATPPQVSIVIGG